MALQLEHKVKQDYAPQSREDLLCLILGRASVSPKRLVAPGPSYYEIVLMIEAAVTAPDHGALTPWRFILIADEARTELAELFAAAKQRRNPDTTADELHRERERALRSPTVLAVVARPQRHNPKVQVREQYASAGAAIQNILLSAHALGYGAIMLSGRKTLDAHLLRELGLGNGEELMGFLCIGTCALPPTLKQRPNATNHLTVWRGSQRASL